jgi:hypothetical protein
MASTAMLFHGDEEDGDLFACIASLRVTIAYPILWRSGPSRMLAHTSEAAGIALHPSSRIKPAQTLHWLMGGCLSSAHFRSHAPACGSLVRVTQNTVEADPNRQ